ncbi:MAG: methyltransferase domain-containing protein, partial [Bacteroidales bacterium]
MNNLLTAERVSNDISDNYVFQRSLLAYYTAANHISNRVLEIGTGTGYGITIVAPKAKSFITIDKNEPSIEILQQAKLIGNTEFRKASVPPLPFADNTFDFVISF